MKTNPIIKGRMYGIKGGGSIRGVRFRKDGKVEVLVQPKTKKNPRRKAKRKNASYRKTKKATKKAQRAGLLEPGAMFQKSRKAQGISKKGRKKNAKKKK